MSNLDYLGKCRDIEAGEVHFPPLVFTHPGQYHFTVRELTKSDEQWKTDARVYPVVVIVTRDETGQLIATVHYPQGRPKFVNRYQEKVHKAVDVHLQSKKVVCGSQIGKHKFTFVVQNLSGDVIARAENDREGNVKFPPLSFDRAGIYKYIVRESARPNRHWKMDENRYPIVIKVTECKAGQLIAQVIYPKGLPVFINHLLPKCSASCVPGSGERIYLPQKGTDTCTKKKSPPER